MNFDQIYKEVLSLIQNKLKTINSKIKPYLILAMVDRKNDSFVLRGESVGNGISDIDFMRNTTLQTLAKVSYFDVNSSEFNYVRIITSHAIYFIVLEGAFNESRQILDSTGDSLKSLLEVK